MDSWTLTPCGHVGLKHQKVCLIWKIVSMENTVGFFMELLLWNTEYSVKCFKPLPLHWLPSSDEFHQNKANLQEQKNKLNVEAENRSKVCDYIVKTSVEGMWVDDWVCVLFSALYEKWIWSIFEIYQFCLWFIWLREQVAFVVQTLIGLFRP